MGGGVNLALAALAYAHHGRRVFPLVPGAKQPATSHGVKDATSDPAKITWWWSVTPNANIGLAVLPHELVVDVDVRSGGRKTLFEWTRDGKKIPTTPTQVTPTGGSHFLFQRPAGFELNGRPAPGIDILGVGKYIVAAPSLIAGIETPYEWFAPCRLSKTPLAPLPDWLRELVLRPPAPPPAPPPDLGKASADVLTRAERWLATCDPAIQGQGGSATCFRVTTRLVRGFALDEDTALHLLETVYNPKCDPPWSRKELKHKIRQAITKGDYEWGKLRDRPLDRRAS